MAAAQVEREAVVAWVGWVPTKNWMSQRVKGVENLSVPPAQYSPGRRRNNNSIQERLAIAWSLGEPPLATESIQWSMETGRGRNLPRGGISSV